MFTPHLLLSYQSKNIVFHIILSASDCIFGILHKMKYCLVLIWCFTLCCAGLSSALADTSPKVASQACYAIHRWAFSTCTSCTALYCILLYICLFALLHGIHLFLMARVPSNPSLFQQCTSSLAEACGGEKDIKTNVLSQFMPFLLEKLLALTNRYARHLHLEALLNHDYSYALWSF